ncbi:MAG: hypothetical protein K2L34_01525 [Muribaculaceae bacterium]|nr:hypothetical protein [Muribaculaceae bacterium]
MTLSSGQQYVDAQIKVEAFSSTDIGNSYYIEVGGADAEKKSFFHAGDLNAWLWADESTQEEVDEALNSYKEILQSLNAKHPEIKYVMFPVDSRIGTGYATGARLFVRTIDVGHFFPMHFGLGESNEELQKRRLDAANIKLYAKPDRGDYICLQAPYSTYLEG